MRNESEKGLIIVALAYTTAIAIIYIGGAIIMLNEIIQAGAK